MLLGRRGENERRESIRESKVCHPIIIIVRSRLYGFNIIRLVCINFRIELLLLLLSVKNGLAFEVDAYTSCTLTAVTKN